VLAEDFSRAGLSVSPNTKCHKQVCYVSEFDEYSDPLYQDGLISGSTARVRSAMVHLNRQQDGNDAVMLSGNLLGSRTYYACSTATNIIQLQNVSTRFECVEQFDKNFAFANVVNTESGKRLDARVVSTEYYQAGGMQVCDLTLRNGDLSEEVIKEGECRFVSANHTAIYWVETVEGRNQLVRYFVNYDANDMPGDCNISGVTSPAGLDGVIPGSIVLATRRVIADYVENFQVWLRPVSMINNGTVPHYYTITDLASQSGAGFSNGFVPSETDCIFPYEADSITSNINDVSCAQTGYDFGAEDLRSAVILMSVRDEMTDQSIDIMSFDENDRLIRHTLRAFSGEGDRPGACYKLKTLIAEVPLVNIASRRDIAAI
jgi:hypothetical protein